MRVLLVALLAAGVAFALVDPDANSEHVHVWDRSGVQVFLAAQNEPMASAVFGSNFTDSIQALSLVPGQVSSWRRAAMAADLFVAAGTTADVVDAGQPAETYVSAGGSDLFVSSWWTNGSLAWVTHLGTPTMDSVAGVAIHPTTHDVYVCSTVHASLSGQFHAGAADLALIKFDSRGQHVWTQQLGGPADDWCRDVVITPRGHVVVVGTSLSANVTAVQSNGLADILLARYNQAGTRLQVKQYGTPGDDDVSQAVVSEDSVLYLAVSTDGQGSEVMLATSGGLDAALVALDADDFGEVWVHMAGTEVGTEHGWGVGVGEEGVYLVGDTNSLFEGESPFGVEDAFVLAIDKETGERLWVEQFGSALVDRPTGVVANSALGSVFVTGWTAGALEEGGEAPDAGQVAGFVAQFGRGGEFEAGFQMTGPGGVESRVLAVVGTSQGHLLLAGDVEGGRFGGVDTLGGGANGFWQMRYRETLLAPRGRLLVVVGSAMGVVGAAVGSVLGLRAYRRKLEFDEYFRNVYLKRKEAELAAELDGRETVTKTAGKVDIESIAANVEDGDE